MGYIVYSARNAYVVERIRTLLRNKEVDVERAKKNQESYL